MATTKKTASRPRRTDASAQSFTAEERAAMKEHAAEVRRARGGAKGPQKVAEEEAAVVAKLAEMDRSDRLIGERLHVLIKAAAPDLTARTWYGMPAYSKDGKIVVFYQPAGKFKTRYATLGFSDQARLDDGTFWPNAYALTELTPAVEKKITALVKKAVTE